MNFVFYFTCVAKTSNSPTAKRTMKPYKLLRQKARKQNIAPKNVAPERSCYRSKVSHKYRNKQQTKRDNFRL